MMKIRQNSQHLPASESWATDWRCPRPSISVRVLASGDDEAASIW